jgi:periplasmic protein TonB
MPRDCIRSPFGSLLDEIREEKVRHADPTRLEPRPRASGGPEVDLHIEAGVVSGAGGREGSPRSWRWAVAIAVHAAFLAAILLVPMVMPEDLPLPATGARAFFVQTIVAPPPPPPAAPAAIRTVARTDAPVPRATRPVVPTIAPEVVPEDVIDSAPPSAPAVAAVSADEGVPGGVDEGVPGGIVGGILQPRTQADEPYAPRTHVRAGVDVKEPRKLKNVAPVYPDVAARGKVEGVVILELAIRPDGRVEEVRVLRSIPLFDEAAVTAARQWVFSPTLLSGVPVSVTMSVSVRFSLTQQAAY